MIDFTISPYFPSKEFGGTYEKHVYLPNTPARRHATGTRVAANGNSFVHWETANTKGFGRRAAIWEVNELLVPVIPTQCMISHMNIH